MMSMTDPDASRELPRHPIQVVSRRTGLTPDLLRAWERRYGAVSPQRSPTNRRLYSDQDIERLRLLRRATSGGRRIGDVSRLPLPELESLVARDQAEQAAAPAPPARGAPPQAGARLAAALEAIEALDASALEALLAGAAVELSVPALIDELLAPLMREVGRRWHDGSLRVAHEHLTSAAVRSFLATLSSAPGNSGNLVVTTPAGQRHEMGALTVALTVALDGWRALYLGPDLPAEEIAAAARQTGARAVLLSIVYPVDDPHLGGELGRLARLLPQGVTVFVGGPGAPAYEGVIERAGFPLVDGIASLRERLEELRFGSAGGRP